MQDLPKFQTAIIGLDNGQLGISGEDQVALPDLEADMIMVKTAAVGINPVDTKMTDRLGTPGAVAGMDFAGTVVATGQNVHTASPIAIGDRVCGAVQGMHSLTPRVGAFAHWIGATDHVTLKLPESMSFEEGAALGSGLSTVGIALFRSLKIPGYPLEPLTEKARYVLVYGGSTATGTLAIQLIKLSGMKPIATCSPHNFELVKSYGAEQVFDYHSKSCTADIRAYTKDSLKFVLDCISEAETIQFCYECIGRLGGRFTAMEPFPDFLHTRPNVVPDWVLGPTVLGKEIGWIPPFARPADPEMRAFGAKLFKTAQKLLDQGKLRTHPLQHMPPGLPGVLDGMELLRRKAISGKKLVCRLD